MHGKKMEHIGFDAVAVWRFPSALHLLNFL